MFKLFLRLCSVGALTGVMPCYASLMENISNEGFVTYVHEVSESSCIAQANVPSQPDKGESQKRMPSLRLKRLKKNVETECRSTHGQMYHMKVSDDSCVEIIQSVPEYATIGFAYPIEILVMAKKNCVDLVLEQRVPRDAEFIKSEPKAMSKNEGKLTWKIKELKRGETHKITAWVKPLKEGCHLTAATVYSSPRLASYTQSGKPVIVINHCGPETACLNHPIQYRVEVVNNGTAVAKGVVVENPVPQGFKHCSGDQVLTYNLGNICPGDQKSYKVEFSPEKRGLFKNIVKVNYQDGAQVVSEFSTTVNDPAIEVSLSGPDWSYVCKEVEYLVKVNNPGDLVLRNVHVNFLTDKGNTVVKAEGAEICANRATWTLAELCPGDKLKFKVVLKSKISGTSTNRVKVKTTTDCGECSSCADKVITWKGLAATHMYVVDINDPICLGEQTSYRVRVSNRGTADDTNIVLVMKFSKELQPLEARGPTQAKITDHTVIFEPLKALPSRNHVDYVIVLKGVAAGDGRGEASLSSDSLTVPVTDVENTHVY